MTQWRRVHDADLHPREFRWQVTGSEAPVAVALLVPRVRYRAGLRFRQLLLNTDGEAPADSVVIENNRVLCLPSHRQAAVAALAAQVRESEADEFITAGIDETELTNLVAAFPRWAADIESRTSHYVDLSAVRARGGDVMDCLRANTRAQLRRSLRKYEELGPLAYDIAQNGSEATAMLEELIGLHEAAWRRKGQAGAFASKKRREFHFGFVEQGVPRGEAHLMRVRAGRQCIGILYNLTAHGRVSFYQSGLRVADDPHFKPGLVSHLLAIRHFSARGFLEYDFLTSAPGEARYKQSLSTDQRTLFWLTLVRPNSKSMALRAARRIRRLLRRPGR